MESAALQIASCVFERIGTDADFLQATLFGIFSCLHFYRNNTKSKVIPAAIMKTIHSFIGTYIIAHDCEKLIASCDKI
jgi:hypothetical protein